MQAMDDLRKKSCLLNGLCRPICIAIFIATELNVAETPLYIVFVGNGHIHTSSMAWTVSTLYGGLAISAQISFMTKSDKTYRSVTSSRYRREATAMIVQNRLVPDV